MSASGQTRLLIARYGLYLAVGLAVLGVVAFGVAATTYAHPSVTQVTRKTETESFSVDSSTSALVTNSSALYAKGTLLRDEPVYFFRASPNLTLHLRTTTPQGTKTTISQRVVLRYEGDRNGKTFYEHRRVLAASKATVAGGAHWSNTTMNLTSIARDAARKRSAIGSVGTFHVTLDVTTHYRTGRYAGTLQKSTGVVLSQRAYWLGGDLSSSATKSTPVTRRVVGAPQVTLVLGESVVGLFCLLGAALVLGRYRSIDRASLETELARMRYDEWISNGEIPTVSAKDYTRTDSLEDLVDVAIDTNNRVIYDRDLDAYAVVQADLVYYYTTQDARLTEWLDV